MQISQIIAMKVNVFKDEYPSYHINDKINELLGPACK